MELPLCSIFCRNYEITHFSSFNTDVNFTCSEKTIHFVIVQETGLSQRRSLPRIPRMQLRDLVKCIYANDSKEGAFANSVDPDESCISSGSAVFAMLNTFLVMVDNIKSYMNQDICHFVRPEFFY